MVILQTDIFVRKILIFLLGEYETKNLCVWLDNQHKELRHMVHNTDANNNTVALYNEIGENSSWYHNDTKC